MANTETTAAGPSPDGHGPTGGLLHNASEARGFRQWTAATASLAGLFAALLFALGRSYRASSLVLGSALLAAAAAQSLALGLRARAPRLSWRTTLLAWTIPLFLIALAFVLPFGFPAFLITALLPTLLALPHQRGRSLIAVVAASAVTVAVITVARLVVENPPELPLLVMRNLSVSGALAAATLLVLLVWQSGSRLRQTLDEITAANLHLTEARGKEKSANDWATFLAEAARTLSESLDYEQTLQRVAQLAVPTIADWCTVAAQLDGTLRRTAVVHRDPAKAELVRRYQQEFPPQRHRAETLLEVVRGSRPLLLCRVAAADLEKAAQSADHLAVMRGLGVSSLIIVPLVARGRTLGAISLMLSEPGHFYGPSDLARAEDLASRAAMAIDNSRLFLEVRDARERLEAAVAARDDFLSIASHELKTPLTPLKLQLDMLARRPDDPRLQQSLPVAQRQVARLQRLVAELLDVSQISADRLRLEPAEIDLRVLVTEVVARFRENQAASPVELEAQGAIQGRWDALRLDQVVTNLLSNAIKYGQGRPVRVQLSEVEGRARLVVTDGGIGIPPEQQSRIFERFERGVTGRHYGGMGLGLWIVRKIVEASGGDVSVQSEVGRGSTFVVVLPLLPADAPNPPTERPRPEGLA